MSSLAERALGWKAAAPAPSAGGEKRKAAQPSGAAKAKAKNSKNTNGVGFFPPSSSCRAAWYADTFRRNGCQYDHITGITYTAGLDPPPHQVSLNSSSKLSSRSSNPSSNLNSSPSSSSSSSSSRRPRGAGFSSQALPTSAGWLMAVGGAEVDVEAPTRGVAAPGGAVSDSQGSANRQSRQQRRWGSQNEGVPCSQTQGGPWDLAVHPSLGHFRRPCSTVRRG